VPPRTAERSIRPAHRLVSAGPRRKPVALHIQTQANAQRLETRHQGRYRGRSRSLGLSPQYQQRSCRGQGVLSRGNQGSGIGGADYHIGRVFGIAPRRARDEGCRPTGRRHEATLIGMNCCAEFKRDRSTSASCTSKIEVRLPTGIRCWRRLKTHPLGGMSRPRLNWHQNLGNVSNPGACADCGCSSRRIPATELVPAR
jgi:hypothetical protein